MTEPCKMCGGQNVAMVTVPVRNVTVRINGDPRRWRSPEALAQCGLMDARPTRHTAEFRVCLECGALQSSVFPQEVTKLRETLGTVVRGGCVRGRCGARRTQ
jgi:hypothetical protein